MWVWVFFFEATHVSWLSFLWILRQTKSLAGKPRALLAKTRRGGFFLCVFFLSFSAEGGGPPNYHTLAELASLFFGQPRKGVT